MKKLKRTKMFVIATVMALSLIMPAFATDESIEKEVIEKSERVTRVDIPNKDGTFTTLEGQAAQDWYDNVIAEGKKRTIENEALYVEDDEVEERSRFRYKYRYLESNRTNDVERGDLEKVVTNKLRNTTSTTQSYQLELSVSQSWEISASLSSNYMDAIMAELGSSWGETYSKSDSFTVDVPVNKTLWVSFIPIMDKSEGKVQKYFIPRGGGDKEPVVEKSYDVETYNPKYLLSKMGVYTFKTVYGVYVWHEE